jgi:hypothetical protein
VRSENTPAAQALTWSALALALLVVGGCGGKPRAPALEDDAVYHNADAGFRFLVPTGWRQRAKADIPRGKVPQQHLLVQYVRVSGEGPAFLEVSLTDVPESDLPALLGSPSHALAKWQPAGPAEPISVGGAPAKRLVFTGIQGKSQMTKEVVVFSRGERVFFVTGIFQTADKEAREQVRGAVASMIRKS